MNNKLIKSSGRQRHRRALTLIEVVAGLALMASVVVSLIWAKSRFDRQEVTAAYRIRAVATADALLAGWWGDPPQFPRGASGRAGPEPSLFWQTRPIPNSALEQVNTVVYRVEVFEQSPSAGDAPLASVDVCLPREVRPRE